MRNEKSRVRLHELDSLRGIACLMVFFFHHSIRFNPDDTHWAFHYGYLGVDLFFMISGFVIYLTLDRTKDWKDFVFHRFSRLYPAYWLCVLLTFLAINLSPFSTEKLPNYMLIFNMTMFQHWVGIKDIDLAYWTLNLELSFYVFMLFAYLSGYLKAYRAIVILMMLPLWLRAIIPAASEPLFHYLTFFRAGHLFGAGIIFYHLYKSEGRLSIVDGILLLLCLLTQPLWRAPFNLIELLHVLVFFVIFFLLAKNKLAWIKVRVLLFYGQISYILYLIHESVGLEILKLFKYIGIENWYLSRGLLLALITVFCYIASKYYEQPLQKWLNAIWTQFGGFKNYRLALSFKRNK